MKDAPIRFGKYELDPGAEELRRDGTVVRLPRQPFRVLLLLARRAGTIVTRDEIRAEVWGSETFVDFEQGINAAIRQIRAALHDTADAPRFLETIPRRGYRFIALVGVRPQRKFSRAVLASLALLVFTPVLPHVHRVAVTGTDARLVEELTARLSRIDPSHVRVVTGRADTIVAATVRQNADAIRVTLRATDARTGAERWMHALDRPPADRPVVAAAAADRAMRAVAQQVLPAPRYEPLVRRAVHPRALALYRRARDGHDFNHVLSDYDEALRLDPRFAEAQSAIAELWLNRALTGIGDQQDAVNRARAAALRALRLDPDSAEGHMCLGRILCAFDRDYARAETHLRRATEIDPDLVQPHWRLSYLLSAMGRHEEALAEYRHVQQREPTSMSPDLTRAVLLFFARRYDEAAAEYRELEQLAGPSAATQYGLISTLIAQRQWDRAFAAIARMLPPPATLGPLPADPPHRHEAFLAALRRIEPLLGSAVASAPLYDYLLASYCAQTGDHERAYAYLDKAIRLHAIPAIALAVDPRFDSLADDPRFQTRLRELKLR